MLLAESYLSIYITLSFAAVLPLPPLQQQVDTRTASYLT